MDSPIKSSFELDQYLLKVPLKESKEILVTVNNNTRGLKLAKTTNPQNWFLRQTVLTKLVIAANKFLNRGYVLYLTDAYRSLDKQKEKFLKHFNGVKKTHPKLSTEKALNLVNTYIAGIPILAAHTAGAAIDVTLIDANGKSIDMGCDYLTFGSKAITQCPELTKSQKTNRLILKNTMEECGFTNYPFEYWHYSIGDVCAAYLTGQKYAKYGPVNYNFKTSEMFFLKDKKKLYQFFAVGD